MSVLKKKTYYVLYGNIWCYCNISEIPCKLCTVIRINVSCNTVRTIISVLLLFFC